MSKDKIIGGIYHQSPADLANAITKSPKALATWNNISPIARNEWICWTITVKQQKTRQEHVKRACDDLAAGKRRPCCWVGCLHRTDKQPGAWARKVLLKQAG